MLCSCVRARQGEPEPQAAQRPRGPDQLVQEEPAPPWASPAWQPACSPGSGGLGTAPLLTCGSPRGMARPSLWGLCLTGAPLGKVGWAGPDSSSGSSLSSFSSSNCETHPPGERGWARPCPDPGWASPAAQSLGFLSSCTGRFEHTPVQNGASLEEKIGVANRDLHTLPGNIRGDPRLCPRNVTCRESCRGGSSLHPPGEQVQLGQVAAAHPAPHPQAP